MESTATRTAQPIILLPPSRLERRLNRLAATNVVNEKPDTRVNLTGRHRIHVSPETARQIGLKRKRVQSRGSKECLGCGRSISANKGHCSDCQPCKCGHASREHVAAPNIWAERPCKHNKNHEFCGCVSFRGVA